MGDTVCESGVRLVIFFAWGLMLGSFYHAWAWRMVREQSIARGRSCCPTCGHELSVRELVPVLSWLWQRGCCRHCGGAIPVRYPLVELLTALLFVSLAWRYAGVQLLSALVLGSLLLVLALVDYDSWLIPDSLLLAGLLLYVPLQWLSGSLNVLTLGQAMLQGCLVAVPLLLFVLAADAVLQKPSMGGGDIKLFFLLGVYLGAKMAMLTLFVSCLVGLLWQLLWQRREQGGAFPFGPSIGLAAWIVLLWGEKMMRWYLLSL